MKKHFLAMALVAAAGVGTLMLNSASAQSAEVLYIASSLTPGQNDNKMIDYIEELGHSVSLVADENAPSPEAAEDYTMVWISATVNHNLIGDMYRMADVPIGMTEGLLYDDMGMGTNSGFAGSQTKVKTVPSNDIVTTTTQGKSYAWANAAGDVEVTAAHRNSSNKSVIFHYADGALLADGSNAEQCRSGFFAGVDSPKVLTAAGKDMFIDVVNRLVDCAVPPVPNEPPVIDPVADQNNTEGDSVNLAITATDPNVDETLQFSVDVLPVGLSLDMNTGVISGDITYRGADSSPYTATATVIDAQGASDSTTFQWTVNDDPSLDPPPVETPNVLVIMTDDQTVEQMRWLPNVSQYMSSGVEYANSITNYPLCGPSRVTFLTGQYATNHGLECNSGLASKFRNVQQDSLAPWLQSAGVHTIHVGKYLNGYGGKTTTRYTPTVGMTGGRSLDHRPTTTRDLTWSSTAIINGLAAMVTSHIRPTP